MFVWERTLEKQGYSARKELFAKIVKNGRCLPEKGQLHYLSIPEADIRSEKNKVSADGDKGSDLEILEI